MTRARVKSSRKAGGEATNGAVAAAAEGPTGAKQPSLSPEARAKLSDIRKRIETSVGQVVLMAMQLPRYRHQTLGDLQHLIVEPLLQDRVAIAYAKVDDGQSAPNSAPIGVALWASVSDEVDAKIAEQVKAGTLPVRLGGDEWASGDKLWLLDIIAPNKRAASAVLMNFGKIAGDRQVRIHPIVNSSIDEETLKKMQLGSSRSAVTAS